MVEVWALAQTRKPPPAGWPEGVWYLLRLRLLGQHPPATDSYSHDRSVVLESVVRVNKQAIVMILSCQQGHPRRTC